MYTACNFMGYRRTLRIQWGNGKRDDMEQTNSRGNLLDGMRMWICDQVSEMGLSAAQAVQITSNSSHPVPS